MSEKKEQKYFNFPIVLLEGFLDDSNKCLTNIVHYALYAKTLDYDFGNEEKRMASAEKYFNNRFKTTSKIHAYENGESIYDSIPYKVPKVGLSISVMADYLKNEKTEFQKVCLLGYLGIRSILQNKAYCKITNKYWLSRMDGKNKAVENLSELSESIQKYANEYQTKKIKSELRDNWFLATYSRYTRGFYVSFNLELDELVYQAEKRRKSTKEKQAKLAEKIALEKALSRLNE